MRKRIICTALVFSVLLQCITGVTSIFATDSDNQQEYFAKMIQKYEGFNTEDPQLITDEDFFGKWDGREWVKQPYFSYEKFPGLNKVEESAKNGDYDSAKEEVLKYYRNRFKEDVYERTPTKTSREYRLYGEMAMENLYLRADFGLPMQRITLTNESNWTETDILTRLKDILNTTTSTNMNIRVHDIHKDGYMGQFNTKESRELDKNGKSTAPYVQMIVNGSVRTYYPVADNTIRAGDFFNTSYSSEPVMLANESYTSIGTAVPIDDYSRRAALLFDFSDITKDDNITSAKLYLYGKMVEDDNPVRPSEVKSSMDLFVVDDRTNMVWEEEGHCWGKEGFDICFSYDGEYGPTICTPTVLSGQWSASVMHQYYLIQYLIELYRGTGNEAYAYHAIRFTLNSALKLGNDFNQVTQPFMQLGVRQYEFNRNIYTMIKSEYMTPEIFTILLKWVHMQLDYLVKGWSNTEEGNNIGALCTRGLLEGALTFHEFRRYYDPKTELSNPQWGGSMQGGWLAVGLYRSIYKLRETVQDDGSSVEIPMGYIHTNLNAFFQPYEWADTIGMRDELATNVSEEDKEYLKKSLYYMINLQNPVDGGWQAGDDSPYTRKIVYDIARFVRFFCGDDDPVVKWAYTVNNAKREGNPPQDYTSYAYDTVAKATLRSSWQSDAVALYTNADGGFKSHGHDDDLAIGLMAYGTYFLADPLKYLYNGDPRIVQWQVSSRAHNTVEINDTSTNGASPFSGLQEEPFGYDLYRSGTTGTIGSLHPETREFNSTYDYMRAETNGYINNTSSKGDFQYWRDILFVKPGYFIVTDYIKPKNDIVNKYSQAWHLNPELEFEIEENSKNIVTKSGSGANLIIAPVNGKDEIEAKTLPGYYSPTGANTALLVNNPYVSFEKNRKGTTTYNTILYPMRAGESKEIDAQPIVLDLPEESANAFEAIVTDKNSGLMQNLAYYTLFDADKKSQQKFGYYSTDAEMVFVEKTSDEYSTAIIRNGTNISVAKSQNKIISCDSPIKHLGIEWKNGVLTISSSALDAIDMDSLRILGAPKITSVLVNGRSVKFYKDGNYICFKDTGSSNPAPPNGGSQGSGGTHGSAGSGGISFGGTGSGATSSGTGTASPVTGNTISDPSEAEKEIFKDIAGHWAEAYIEKASEKKIIFGNDNGCFEPDCSVTRAELASMAVRMLGAERCEYDGSFSDVSSSDWYAETVAQSLKLGIISPDISFRPNDLVTREEMCKILVETAKRYGAEFSEESEEKKFSDSNEISEWAVEYVNQAVSAGLMQGIDSEHFQPSGNATRAQAATVIVRILENV